MISDKTIEDVLLATDLVALVREYAPDLQKRGRDYVCRCPFHQENTASFHVSPERGYWRCFGACQTGGDAIKFVMLHDGLPFPQAVEFLARRAGIMIEEEPLTEAQAATARRKQAMMELNGRVAAWYVEQLHSEAGAAALEYARGLFGDDEPERATMGYAPRSGDALYRWARATGESLELLEELHLIARNKEQGTFYDFMRDRLVYPIRDARRNVIGFTARDLSGQSPAKYVNSAESEVYHKARSIYGYEPFVNGEAMRKEQYILVEGAADAVKMHSVGVLNVVAPLGGSWTDEQFAMLRKHAPAVCFINDADPAKEGETFGAGIQYVMSNGRRALAAGLKVSVRELPLGAGGEKQDPGSYFTNKGQLSVLDELSFVHWYALKVWDKGANINQKADLIQQISEVASYITDENQLSLLLDELVKLRRGTEFWRNAINREKWKRLDAATARTKEISLRTFGFVEERGCYYGLTDKADVQWSNFTLKPLFHIKDEERPVRLFEIKGVGTPKPELVEMDMDELNSVQKFRRRLEGLGNYIWTGNENDMLKLKRYLYECTDSARKLNMLGWDAKGGFYAFANGVWRDGTFYSTDANGVARVPKSAGGAAEECVYLPQGGTDEQGNEAARNKMRHDHVPVPAMQQYLRDFVQVFGDNGRVGLCYWLASLFRDVVTGRTRSFPLLCLFGPKGSGKTELGTALMAFVVTGNLPPSLANSTQVALNEAASFATDAMVHFDEYKNEIHSSRIEMLKGMYDGVGRTRMGGADFRTQKMTSVRSGVIISGQEMPTQDIALFSRTIFLSFPRCAYTPEESRRFAALQEIQRRGGLTEYTLQVLQHRGRVQGGFARAYQETTDDVDALLGGKLIETRIRESWCKLLAVLRCLDTCLPLPMRYKDMLPLCFDLMTRQNGLSREGNELGHFWSQVSFLSVNGDIHDGADYRLRVVSEIKTDKCAQEYAKPQKVLFLNPTRIFNLYREAAHRAGETVIPDDALRQYMENMPAYLGRVATRFAVAGKSGVLTNAPTRTQRALVFNAAMLLEEYGFSLDNEATPIGADERQGLGNNMPF